MTNSLRFAAILILAAIGILQSTTHADTPASAGTLAATGTVTYTSPDFSDVPPFILFHACPQWAAARGHQDYYRYNYDRPFALGDESGDIWQLRTMTREVPGSVFSTYLFIQNTDRLDRLAGLFEKYLEAAKSVEGATVVPIIHAIGDKRPEKLHLLAKHLLERFATHPSWHRIKNQPLMVDYAAGGFWALDPGRTSQPHHHPARRRPPLHLAHALRRRHRLFGQRTS